MALVICQVCITVKGGKFRMSYNLYVERHHQPGMTTAQLNRSLNNRHHGRFVPLAGTAKPPSWRDIRLFPNRHPSRSQDSSLPATITGRLRPRQRLRRRRSWRRHHHQGIRSPLNTGKRTPLHPSGGLSLPLFAIEAQCNLGSGEEAGGGVVGEGPLQPRYPWCCRRSERQLVMPTLSPSTERDSA